MCTGLRTSSMTGVISSRHTTESGCGREASDSDFDERDVQSVQETQFDANRSSNIALVSTGAIKHGHRAETGQAWCSEQRLATGQTHCLVPLHANRRLQFPACPTTAVIMSFPRSRLSPPAFQFSITLPLSLLSPSLSPSPSLPSLIPASPFPPISSASRPSCPRACHVWPITPTTRPLANQP